MVSFRLKIEILFEIQADYASWSRGAAPGGASGLSRNLGIARRPSAESPYWTHEAVPAINLNPINPEPL